MLALIILIALVVLAIVATVLTEVEHFGVATLTLIGSLVGVQLFHNTLGFNLLSWVEGHAVESVVLTAGYVLVGVIWSFVKWFSYLMSYRDKFREQKEAFLKSRNLVGQVPEDQMEDFRKYLRENFRWDSGHREILGLERPRASKNKSRIVAWMSLWPFSLVGTVLNDPVRRLFNFLFNWFKALYQKMADSIFAKDVELK